MSSLRTWARISRWAMSVRPNLHRADVSLSDDLRGRPEIGADRGGRAIPKADVVRPDLESTRAVEHFGTFRVGWLAPHSIGSERVQSRPTRGFLKKFLAYDCSHVVRVRSDPSAERKTQEDERRSAIPSKLRTDRRSGELKSSPDLSRSGFELVLGVPNILGSEFRFPLFPVGNKRCSVDLTRKVRHAEHQGLGQLRET